MNYKKLYYYAALALLMVPAMNNASQVEQANKEKMHPLEMIICGCTVAFYVHWKYQNYKKYKKNPPRSADVRTIQQIRDLLNDQTLNIIIDKNEPGFYAQPSFLGNHTISIGDMQPSRQIPPKDQASLFHEYGHLDKKHQPKALALGVSLGGLVLLTPLPSNIMLKIPCTLSQLAIGAAIMMAYSRKQEYEADDNIPFHLLPHAIKNYRNFLEIEREIQQEDKQYYGKLYPIYSVIDQLRSTHPSNEHRIKRMQQRLAENPGFLY